MLNETMDQVVLVKGWKKNANWSFPRGKINKDEDDLVCAMREVYEETGFDIEKASIVPENKNVMSIEIAMREQHMRLFVFRGIPMDTHFEPRTRKEISKIQWWKLSDLPTLKKMKQQQGEPRGEDLATNANKFYMVAPFLGSLKRWISQQKKQDSKKGLDGQNNGTAIEEAVITDTDPFTEDRIPSMPPRDHLTDLPNIEHALDPNDLSQAFDRASKALDGSDRLKSLLRVLPPHTTPVLSTNTVILETENPHNHKAKVLLETAKAPNPVDQIKPAVTPLERLIETPVLPSSVKHEHHIHRPRERPLPKVNSPPKYSLNPGSTAQPQTDINSGFHLPQPQAVVPKTSMRPTNPPILSHYHTLNPRLPYNIVSSTPFNTYSSAKTYQQYPIHYQHTVDNRLGSLAAEQPSHGPLIPPASQLPQPKHLPADKSALLGIFMSSKNQAETKLVEAPSGPQPLPGSNVHGNSNLGEGNPQTSAPAIAVAVSVTGQTTPPTATASTSREAHLVSKSQPPQEQPLRSEILPLPFPDKHVLPAESAAVISIPATQQGNHSLLLAAGSRSVSKTITHPKTILHRNLQKLGLGQESVGKELATPRKTTKDISTPSYSRISPSLAAEHASTPAPPVANALLELFKTPSESERASMALPTATLAPPNAPIELSAQPSPGHSREPSSNGHTQLRGTRRRGTDGRFSAQNHHELNPRSKTAAVSATVTGPLDIPHFEAIRQFKESKMTRNTKRPSVSPEIRQASPVRILKRPDKAQTLHRALHTDINQTASSKSTDTKAIPPECATPASTEAKLFQPHLLRRPPQPQTSLPEVGTKTPMKVGIPTLSSLITDRRTNQDPLVKESLLSLFGSSSAAILASQSPVTHVSPVSASYPRPETTIATPPITVPSMVGNSVLPDKNGPNIGGGQKTPGMVNAIDKNFLLGFLAGQT